MKQQIQRLREQFLGYLQTNQQKKSLPSSDQDQSPNFKNTEDRVFTTAGDKVYIGKELVTPQMRDILRDQARYFKTTNLFEILIMSIDNEAYNLALIQSGKSGDTKADVDKAKMLHHWNHVLKNMIHALSK